MNKSGWVLTGLFLCAACCVIGAEPTVLLHETFDSHTAGPLLATPPLRRVMQVSIADGKGRVGTGNVAHFHDVSESEGGALEYSVGNAAPGSMYIEFDLLNNNPGELPSKHAIIFSVAPWDDSQKLSLNANARRAFGIEFSQDGSHKSLVLRVGSEMQSTDMYEMSASQNIKIWINDHDTKTLSYKRPDTAEDVLLDGDSFVVWINDQLAGYQLPTGLKMQQTVSAGNSVLGRVGFGSPSHGLVDFMIDNLHVEDPTGTSAAGTAANLSKAPAAEVTPESIPGATTLAYRKGEDAMDLFVFRPEGWKAGDKRSALIYFFGGGWTKGTPLKSAGWARWAAQNGMVGIAPDYRTKNRFGTSPLESVADGRAVLNWVIQNADKLGIDPQRIAVGGSSAGGHVALWTAIQKSPPGSSTTEAPTAKPAALFLSSAVTDTSGKTGYTPQRFGDHAVSLSPVHQLDEAMPPILMFHACDDELVDYSTAVALYSTMKASGNECELISVPRGGHGFSSAFPEWKTKVRDKLEEFMKAHHLLPAH